jgi:hypothetical protein
MDPASSAILLALRVVYFLASRRFLLATLDPTLRDISAPESTLPLFLDDDATAGGIELQGVDAKARTVKTVQSTKLDKQETKSLNRAAR